MRGNLSLTDSRDFLFDHDFSLNVFDDKFEMSIYVDNTVRLNYQLHNKQEFIESVDAEKAIAEDLECYDEELDKTVEYIKNNFNKLFDSVDEICLNFEETDYLDFIRNNPIVLTKKLILHINLEISDYDESLKLINKYSNIMDKVFIRLDNNSEPVSLKDCYKTIKTIKEQADKISKLGLSPMETIMYVYDQVRNRVYKYEDEDEEQSKSRDLTEVLFSDKIVCLGYANVMSALLSCMGIKSNVVRLIDEKNKNGHARNAIYVNDSKYDIDGVYYFDATWESKKEENNNSYLNSYKYFAKTKSFFDENSDYVETFLEGYSEDLYDIVEEYILAGEYDKVNPYYKIISHMFNMANREISAKFFCFVPGSPVYGNFDKNLFLSELKDVCNKFVNEIPAETMINLFYNVRKIEYYQNPEWYPFDLVNMCYVANKSGWNLNDFQVNFLINNLGLKDRELEIRIKMFKAFAFENEIPKEIEEVKLAKVLRNVLENKRK